MEGLICIIIILVKLWIDYRRDVQIQKERGEYTSFVEILREPMFDIILLAIVVWFVAWYFANNGDGIPRIIGIIISFPPPIIFCVFAIAAFIKYLIDPPPKPKPPYMRHIEAMLEAQRKIDKQKRLAHANDKPAPGTLAWHKRHVEIANRRYEESKRKSEEARLKSEELKQQYLEFHAELESKAAAEKSQEEDTAEK